MTPCSDGYSEEFEGSSLQTSSTMSSRSGMATGLPPRMFPPFGPSKQELRAMNNNENDDTESIDSVSDAGEEYESNMPLQAEEVNTRNYSAIIT